MSETEPKRTEEAQSAADAPKSDANEVMIQAFGLKKYYPVTGGPFKRHISDVKAVDGVDLRIDRGDTHGLVGESGCGKSSLARVLVGLEEPTDGNIYFNVPEETADEIAELEKTADESLSSDERIRLTELQEKYEIGEMEGERAKNFRKNVQFVFQNPTSSLNPRSLIRDIVSRPLRLHTDLSAADREERTVSLLEEVGLGEDYLYRYPHTLSGGQKQRVAVARAIAANPHFVALDEPTSALDVSVQAQMINLLENLQEKFGLTYLFITHDLGVVRHMSKTVSVMYLGKVVERTTNERLFNEPKHPYTEALISSSPAIESDEDIHIEGDVPDPEEPPSGCRFHPRCHKAEAFCGWNGEDMISLLEVTADDDPDIYPLYEGLERSEVDGYKAELEFDEQVDIKKAERILSGETSHLRSRKSVLFEALKRCEIDGSTVRLEFEDVDPPKLQEGESGHHVSCLLWE